MIGNQKEPIKRKQQSRHDLLIEQNAIDACRQGASEKSCPYQYDLRAKKIWLSAFKKEKRRVAKSRTKDRIAAVAPDGVPAPCLGSGEGPQPA